MVSYSGSSGSSGKGLGSGWVTSGGLGGGWGGESARDWVSDGEDFTGETAEGSGKDWSVTAESEVPSTGSRHRAGSRDLVVVKKTVQGRNWGTKAWEPALHARARQVVHRGELGT